MDRMYVLLICSFLVSPNPRSCQGSGYKASCGTGRPCSALGTSCIGGACLCGAVSYWDANTHSCEPKVPLGAFCLTTEACITNNSVCSANRCECYGPHYQQVDRECKIDLGYACATTSECADNYTLCTSDSPMSAKVCTCDTATHYDTNRVVNRGGDCLRKSGLGDHCPFREACITPHSVCSGNKCQCATPTYEQINSTCKLDLGYACATTSECADNNTLCTSDSPMSTKVCTCDTTTHYDTNRAANRGGDCLRNLGYRCTSASDCADDHSVCTEDSHACACNTTTHYDDNTPRYSGGDCVHRSSLGQRCLFTSGCLTANSVCSANTCVCAGPKYQQVNSTCKLDLGYACTTTADCADRGATCSGEPRVCTCNTDTYYDDNGVANRGGTCKQRVPVVG